jgi:hypothetical protein
MNINIRNFIITGILGGLIGCIFHNPLIFVPLAFISGLVCSILSPFLRMTPDQLTQDPLQN